MAERASPFAPVRPHPLSLRPGISASGTVETPVTRNCAVLPEPRIVAVAPPIEGLSPKYTFANFVVGPSNQLAHAASMAAAGVGGHRRKKKNLRNRNKIQEAALTFFNFQIIALKTFIGNTAFASCSSIGKTLKIGLKRYCFFFFRSGAQDPFPYFFFSAKNLTILCLEKDHHHLDRL